MKFITEEDLRDLYRKEPFKDFALEQGARMTPGARQFLIDKGINTFDSESFRGKEKSEEGKPKATEPEKKFDRKHKKLYCTMKSLEALFFLTEQELLSIDVSLAENIVNLGKQFSGILRAVKNKSAVEGLYCAECTGINEDNFCEELDDCFEITEFHIHLEKGREILLLHRLRCELQELTLAIPQLCEDENGQCDELIGKVNQIINSLSQLICLAYGGKKCLRQK